MYMCAVFCQKFAHFSIYLLPLFKCLFCKDLQTILAVFNLLP